jgi:hypothetical protein
MVSQSLRYRKGCDTVAYRELSYRQQIYRPGTGGRFLTARQPPSGGTRTPEITQALPE